MPPGDTHESCLRHGHAALRINLRARQYEVLTAGTGREALALAANHPPDAIILDLGLPDIDGTEVIIELRRWYRAPIIVLSGRNSPGDKDRRAGRRRRRLRDQAVYDGQAAGQAARRAAPGRGRGRAGQPREALIGQWLVDLTAHQIRRAPADASDASGDGGELVTDAPADADRMANPVDPAPAAGQLVGSAQLLTAVWDPASSSGPTISASTWPGCAASWRTTRRGPAICAPNPAWATATNREAPVPGRVSAWADGLALCSIRAARQQ